MFQSNIDFIAASIITFLLILLQFLFGNTICIALFRNNSIDELSFLIGFFPSLPEDIPETGCIQGFRVN